MEKTSTPSDSSIRTQLVAAFIAVGAATAVLLLLVNLASSTTALVVAIVAATVIVAAVGLYAVRAALRPIERLAASTDLVSRDSSLQRLDARLSTEVASIAENFNALMGRIRSSEKTIEELRVIDAKYRDLESQAAELRLSYNNTVALGEIGQRITAFLDLDEIVDTLYKSVNSMMDASAFGLGIYDEQAATVSFGQSIEKGRRLPPFVIPMSDRSSLAVWSILNRQDVFLNDLQRDYARYVATSPDTAGTSELKSALFCPMYVGATTIGVIGVQSFHRNAFTSYHLDMVRALASYTAVALDNANAYQKLNTALAELKEAQSQLVQSEKMASLGQLTAGIAHEINNPINFVSGNVRPLQRDISSVLEVLRNYQEINAGDGVAERLEKVHALREELEIDYVIEEIEQLIRGIDDGARRTAEIVRGLRNFSRVDESDLKRIDVHEGLDSTLVLLHNTYKERIEVIREYSPLPEIECFPGQLNQVFMNLLTNAVQAIEGPGTITIRTERDCDVVRVIISDTGPGVPDEVKQKIFDPFFTTKDVGKGTGLGLSISLGIIRRHNGTIEVDSAPSKGTTFTVTLPITHAEAIEAPHQ